MRKIFIFLIAMAIGTIANAQTLTLTILDKTTGKPVEKVSYYADNQSGVSNEKGEIILPATDIKFLKLSHISYGNHTFTGKVLKEMLSSGKILFTENVLTTLNSISVYALKERNPKASISLQNADWVHHDAGSVLKQIPGFDAIKKSPAFGFDPTFRGFKLDQLNIVNDGCMCATAACPNRMDPPTSQIAINQIQEIEVIKGPHSFRFGPGMGAVVNFKMLDPEFSSGLTQFGRITGGYESNGGVYRTEGQIGLRGKRISTSLNGSYSKGGDYKAGNDSLVQADFSRGTFGIITDIETAKNQVLSINVNRNFARNTDFPVLMMDLLTDDTWMTQGKYKISRDNHWFKEWTTQVSAGIVDHLMGNKLRNNASMLAQTDANTKTINARTEFLIEKAKSKFFVGADTKYETISGNRTREMLMGPNKGKTFTDYIWQDGEVSRYGVFADSYHQFGKNTLSVAARVDQVTGNARTPAETFMKNYTTLKNSDINVSASIGISTKLTETLTAGAWLGRGVRSANISERFINYLAIGKDPYEMLGNPDLKPENNNQLDLNLTYKTVSTILSFSGYYSIVSDFISSKIEPTLKPLMTAPGVRRYINIDKATLYGFEANWSQRYAKLLTQQFTLAYTYGENHTDKMPLPEISPMNLRYTLEADLLNSRLQPYASLRYSFKQDRIATNFGEVATDAFKVVDFGLKAAPIHNLQTTLSLTNAFNENYREHLSRFISVGKPLLSQGRSFVVNISYLF
ncbi:MAG: TonB-dependent receptor [Cytophagaceae bacterium]|nr:TonB-dependent receptor [Cytophagaceae bacterium]MBL0301858.1 TonB-dependent receptor [Cytophagaceae bacterium]MBL0324684.1 TonB-dependent receptor [Cytophagaceae bacterium]